MNKTGKPPHDKKKSIWAIAPRDYDEDQFDTQILRLLNNDDIEPSYSDFT